MKKKKLFDKRIFFSRGIIIKECVAEKIIFVGGNETNGYNIVNFMNKSKK